MDVKPVRKEVHLYVGTIGRLQILADKKKWSLKKYMEDVLERNSLKATQPLIKQLKSKGKP
jgi:hypothetical protein